MNQRKKKGLGERIAVYDADRNAKQSGPYLTKRKKERIKMKDLHTEEKDRKNTRAGMLLSSHYL